MLKPAPFGKYFLLERINVGGMAEVFKAKAYGVEGFERLYAVKKILPQIAADKEFIDMFIDEAKIAVQLNHASIAQVFDLGKVDGAYFIAMEYVSGKDLRTIFDQARRLGKRWSIPQACFVIMQACEGLDYAHNKREQGRELHLVHRDISPQNVLISYDGAVKIIDFGIAKAAGRASKTQAGILKGKFGYMSPEQVRNMELDHRSDLFSLGIILHELLTGERLFYAENDFSILDKIRNVEIALPTSINAAIPQELERIVLRALSEDREQRYQSAAEIHDDLQKFMFSHGLFYTRKDLAGYMREMFAEDIAREQALLEEYRKSTPQPEVLSHSSPPQPQLPPLARPQSPVSWTKPPVRPSTPPALDPGGGSSTGPHWMGSLPPGTPLPVKPVPPGNGVYPGGDGASLLSPSAALVPSARMASASLEWDEDEETAVYDRPSRSPGLEIGDLSDADIVYAGPRSERSVAPPPSAAPPPRSRTRLGFLVVFTLAAILGAAVVGYVIDRYLNREATLQITTAPADGIEVLLDGRSIHRGATPITVKDLAIGRHELKVRHPEHHELTEVVTLQSGQQMAMTLELVPLHTPRATLLLNSQPPGATVEIDGTAQQGVTPLELGDLAPGAHQLIVRLAHHEPWSQNLELEAGKVLEHTAKLKPATVKLELTSDPAGAQFVLKVLPDGEPRSGKTPSRLEALPAGKDVEVVFELNGHVPRTRVKSLRQASDTLHVVLERQGTGRRVAHRDEGSSSQPAVRPSPPVEEPPDREPVKTSKPTEPGMLVLASKPQARVSVDDIDIGYTPIMKHPLMPGKHRVKLYSEKFGCRTEFNVDISSGQETRVFLTDSNPWCNAPL